VAASVAAFAHPGAKLSIGQTAERKRTFSEEDVNTFAEISGDNNPLHVDPAFAKTTRFKKPIVHGVLLSG
jgi:acyl dehydratase